MVVDSPLHEMFIGRLRSREQVFTDAAGESSAVRQRKQVQVRSDLRVQWNRAPINNAAPGIRVRDECRSADAQPFNEPLISKEVKCLVALNRSAQRRPKLVSLKRRDRPVVRIEEIFRIKDRITQEFEGGSVKTILTGSRHGIDHTTGRSPEFRRIRVRQNLEFEHGFYTKQYAGRRAWRLVIHIVDVGAVEQKVVLLGPRAVNRNFWSAAANNVVASG